VTSLILPDYARAPLIVPGRRDRKVYWNRALSKAIDSLGTFEREDWRSAKWLPKSLRGFYPKWFASKNKAGCTCCGEEDPNYCFEVLECFDADWAGGSVPTDAEVELPAMTDLNCGAAGTGSCADFSGTYILNNIGAALYQYQTVTSPGAGFCSSSLEGVTVELQLQCLSNACDYEGRFELYSFQAPSGQYSHDAVFQPSTSPKGTSLPWTFPLVSDGLVSGYTDGHVCNLSGDMLVTAFT
jgi:hypothetical protein